MGDLEELGLVIMMMMMTTMVALTFAEHFCATNLLSNIYGTVPGTVLRTSQVLIHLILTKIL